MRCHVLCLPILALILTSTTSYSQASTERPRGRLSVLVNVGHEIPVSSTMRATSSEFRNDVFDRTVDRYPFGDDRTQSLSFGGEISYRLPDKPNSVVLGFRRTGFLT